MKPITVTPRLLPGAPGYVVTFFHPVMNKRITRSLKTRDKYQAMVTCRTIQLFANNPKLYENFKERIEAGYDRRACEIFFGDEFKVSKATTLTELFGAESTDPNYRRTQALIESLWPDDWDEIPTEIIGMFATQLGYLVRTNASKEDTDQLAKMCRYICTLILDDVATRYAARRAAEAHELHVMELQNENKQLKVQLKAAKKGK